MKVDSQIVKGVQEYSEYKFFFGKQELYHFLPYPDIQKLFVLIQHHNQSQVNKPKNKGIGYEYT